MSKSKKNTSEWVIYLITMIILVAMFAFAGNPTQYFTGAIATVSIIYSFYISSRNGIGYDVTGPLLEWAAVVVAVLMVAIYLISFI